LAGEYLRLSIHCQPRVSVGRIRLRPQNMQEGPDRIAYLTGMVEYMNERLALGADAHTLDVLRHIPFADQLVELKEEDGRWRARELPDARDQLTFDLDRVAVTLLDARRRRERARRRIGTGAATPAFARCVSALARGIDEAELIELCGEELELDALLPALLGEGIVERAAAGEDRVAPQLRELPGDSVTWMGHAAVLHHSGGRTIWIDPLLVPRMTWLPEEVGRVFRDEHAESLLFAPYSPEAANLGTLELPRPDLVLLTHQDIDHVDPGVLMMLPEEVPIVVPRADPRRPWEVDLVRLLAQLLGASRRIVALGHGERLAVGGVAVTAFPFRGEMPDNLAHSWNCYLLETDSSAVAFTADSRIHQEEVELLIAAQRGKSRPLTLFAGLPGRRELIPGWREEPEDLYNCMRLYPWYSPLVTMFQPTRFNNLAYSDLERLAREAGLRSFFPYATGSAPWFRLEDKMDPLHTSLISMSRRELEQIGERLAALEPRVALLPARYGRPLRVD
jgi:L-ascorbate metabolism protein UlaG (beta-lactamase superfamily)